MSLVQEGSGLSLMLTNYKILLHHDLSTWENIYLHPLNNFLDKYLQGLGKAALPWHLTSNTENHPEGRSIGYKFSGLKHHISAVVKIEH